MVIKVTGRRLRSSFSRTLLSFSPLRLLSSACEPRVCGCFQLLNLIMVPGVQRCHLGETSHCHHDRYLCVACDYLLLCSQYVLCSFYRCVPEIVLVDTVMVLFTQSSEPSAFAEVDRLGSFRLELNRTNLPRSSYGRDQGTCHCHTRGRLCLAHFVALGFTTS